MSKQRPLTELSNTGNPSSGDRGNNSPQQKTYAETRSSSKRIKKMVTNFQFKQFTFFSCNNLLNVGFLGLIFFGAGLVTAFVGDSLYGKVTALKSATEMTFDYESGRYEIRLVGIEVPKNASDSAAQFVSKMILGKNARIRFEGRTQEGVMMVRLFTDDSINDPINRIREVAIELVKAGLAQRLKNYDFKYGELATAEREAKKEKRGIWGRKFK